MNSRDNELQIVVRSPYKVPDGWLVEQRPRVSNPNHIDRYYIEPHTGQKFRSLASVQRYLNGETSDYLPTERMISENKNNLPFKLPDGWLVEHRPRPSNPGYIDRYYIEPHTGQKFRSLVSVQRYLNEETRDYLPTDRMISENEDTTFVKSRTAQNFPSVRDFEARKFLPTRDFEGRSTGENACRTTPKTLIKSSNRQKFRRPASDFEGGRLTAENACTVTPKLVFKCGSGKQSAPSMKSYEKDDFQKRIKTGEDDRGSIHDLTRPPTKVTWVLSGPRGFWNPFLDDSIVPASEKRKWSEAFSISINEGATSGVNS